MGLRKTQNAFTGGEISPRLEGRTDLRQYGNSVSELENFFPHSYGGVAKAPGLYFCAETKDSTKISRLIPFERKIGQAYMMEVGDFYIRFYRDGAQIQLAGVPYEVTTPWGVDDIWDLQFTQSVDVMWITHEDHKTRKLSRFTETNWTLTEETFIDGPFMPINPTSTSCLSSAASGSVTLTFNSTGGINENAGFQSTDVGRLVRVYNPDAGTPDWGWGIITAVGSTTVVTVTVSGGTFPTVTPTDLWRLGSFSDTTGWPRHCMFFQQRLCYAGTRSEPQGLWLSQTDAYSVFTVSYPLVDSDACQFILVADQVNDINWLMASRELAIGTLRGEWALSGAEGKVISPTSVNAKRYTTSGGTNIKPVHVEAAVLFVDRSRRGLMEMAYVFEDDGYNAPDLMLLADHLTRSTQIVDTAYQGKPDSKVYCVLDDGNLAVLTYKRKEEVVGWSRRTTQGSFESAATVSSSYRDVPYFIVNRTINGVTKRFVEWMKADFGDAVEDNPIGLLAAPPQLLGDIWVGQNVGNNDEFYINGLDPDLPGGHDLADYSYLLGTTYLVYPGANLGHKCVLGKIGVHVYCLVHYEFPTPNVIYIYKVNTFTSTAEVYTVTGWNNDTYSSWFQQAGVLPDPADNLTPLFFGAIYDNIVGTRGYYAVKGTFNDTTMEVELDWDNKVSYEDDLPPTWDYNNMAPNDQNSTVVTAKYNGCGRLTGNSKHICIPGANKLRDASIDPYTSAMFIFDYDLTPVADLKSLNMTQVDYLSGSSATYHQSHLTDYYLLNVIIDYRDAAAEARDPEELIIEIYALIDDGVGGEDYSLAETTGFRFNEDLTGIAGCSSTGAQAVLAWGQDIYVVWLSYSDGTFVSKFKWNGSQVTHVKTINCSAGPTWSFGDGTPLFDIIADERLLRT